MGRRGNVALTMSYVEAVTGEHVLVGGNRAEKGKGKAAKLTAEIVVTTAVTGGLIGAFWLFEKGHDTSIPPGTAFSVYTVGNTTIDLSLLTPAATAPSTAAQTSLDNSSSPSSMGETRPDVTQVATNALPRAMSSSPTTFPALGVVVKTMVNIGAEVVGIAQGSAADRAGLRVGNVIAEVDGNRIWSVRDLAALDRWQASLFRIVPQSKQ